MTAARHPTARISLAERRRCVWRPRVYSPAWWRGRTYDGVRAYMVAEYTLCGIIFDPDYLHVAANDGSGCGSRYLVVSPNFDPWTDGALVNTELAQNQAEEVLCVGDDIPWWDQIVRGQVLGAVQPYHNTTPGGFYTNDDQGLWRFV